jgi:hypothetical protein
MMVVPCFNLKWTHYTMHAGFLLASVTHFSTVITRLWTLKLQGGVLDLDCFVQVVFDTPVMPMSYQVLCKVPIA